MPSEVRPQQSPPSSSSTVDTIVRLLLLIALLWLFLFGVNALGASFSAFGKGFAGGLMRSVENPIVGLVIGTLVTSLVQSSSTTTSLIVGLVGAGELSVSAAVPMVMGANIGTTVTNTLVSLGSVARGAEFRRTFAAATIHDVFNFMAVALLLPLELLFGLISRPSQALAAAIYGVRVGEVHSPLKDHFKLVVGGALNGLTELFGTDGGKFACLALSLVAIFLSLGLIVKTMKGVIMARTELIFDRLIGRSVWVALLFGAVLTATVQSSSITTSLLVPLAGAGVITLQQLFPITLGCNVGTTVTALIASLATARVEGLAIALCHLTFNLLGIAVIYPVKPLRNLALRVAGGISRLVVEHKILALAYVIGVFFALPGLILGLQKLLGD